MNSIPAPPLIVYIWQRLTTKSHKKVQRSTQMFCKLFHFMYPCVFLSFSYAIRFLTVVLPFYLHSLEASSSGSVHLQHQAIHIRNLRNLVPMNVYFLKKAFSHDSSLTVYIVYPKCSAIYHEKDCTTKQCGGLVESAKCS